MSVSLRFFFEISVRSWVCQINGELSGFLAFFVTGRRQQERELASFGLLTNGGSASERARASPGSPLSRERADVMRRRARASERAGWCSRARGVKPPTKWIYDTEDMQTESCFPNANE